MIDGPSSKLTGIMNISYFTIPGLHWFQKKFFTQIQASSLLQDEEIKRITLLEMLKLRNAFFVRDGTDSFNGNGNFPRRSFRNPRLLSFAHVQTSIFFFPENCTSVTTSTFIFHASMLWGFRRLLKFSSPVRPYRQRSNFTLLKNNGWEEFPKHIADRFRPWEQIDEAAWASGGR